MNNGNVLPDEQGKPFWKQKRLLDDPFQVFFLPIGAPQYKVDLFKRFLIIYDLSYDRGYSADIVSFIKAWGGDQYFWHSCTAF
jgi:hypothetical protein